MGRQFNVRTSPLLARRAVFSMKDSEIIQNVAANHKRLTPYVA